jgi:hypothetical protein
VPPVFLAGNGIRFDSTTIRFYYSSTEINETKAAALTGVAPNIWKLPQEDEDADTT